jgi:hypothetical protein
MGDSLPLPAQNVASFLSPNSADTLPSDFSALINWGDGQSTIGNVVGPIGGALGFNVTGSHIYTSNGVFTTTVTITEVNGPTSIGIGLADISAPSVYATTGRVIVVPVSQLFSGIVGTFTDPNTNDLASSFVASIAWGDGNTTPATVIGSNGSFAVEGTYTYTTPGTYTITATVADQEGNTFTVTGTAQVANINLSNNSTALSGGLAPVPGNGPYAPKGYTNTNQPTFSGTATPFAIVQLYARPFGIDTQEPLGETVTNSFGQWSLTVGPLLPGTYNISAIVTPSTGSPSPMTSLANDGLVHIDMVPKASKAEVRHQKTLAHHWAPGPHRSTNRRIDSELTGTSIHRIIRGRANHFAVPLSSGVRS